MTNTVWSAAFSIVSMDGVFRGRGNHGELCGFSWAIGPLGKWSIGVRVDHGHGAAVARELGGEQHCRRGFADTPLGLANTMVGI